MHVTEGRTAALVSGRHTSQSVLGSPHASTAGTRGIPSEREAALIEGYTKPGQPGGIRLHYLQSAGITMRGSAAQPKGIRRWTFPLRRVRGIGIGRIG